MTPFTQAMLVAVSAGLPTLTVLVSLLITNQHFGGLNRRFSDLEKRMDQRFADLRDSFRSELFRVEQVMDARLKHLEEHLQG